MEKISPGQIYLADQRCIIENSAFRRYSSFNHGDNNNLYREAFGPLEALNDEMLAAAKRIDISVKNTGYFVLMPITGAVLITDTGGNDTVVDVGEFFICYATKGSTLVLTNPYHNDHINFLYLQINAGENTFPFFKQTFYFDFANDENRLIPLVPGAFKLPFSLHIGRFTGRADALYQLKNTHSLFYAFVVAGAFEVQGRLMHERDGLALWDLEEADMEALSNNAVMLILEMEQ